MGDEVKVKVRFVVSAEVTLSKRLLDEVMEPEWQADFYKFEGPDDVAHHVAYNLLRGLLVPELDGFAQLETTDARLDKVCWEEDRHEDLPG